MKDVHRYSCGILWYWYISRIVFRGVMCFDCVRVTCRVGSAPTIWRAWTLLSRGRSRLRRTFGPCSRGSPPRWGGAGTFASPWRYAINTFVYFNSVFGYFCPGSLVVVLQVWAALVLTWPFKEIPSTRVDEGTKGLRLLAIKMQGTNRSGEGGRMSLPCICDAGSEFTTVSGRERQQTGEDNKWDEKNNQTKQNMKTKQQNRSETDVYIYMVYLHVFLFASNLCLTIMIVKWLKISLFRRAVNGLDGS